MTGGRIDSRKNFSSNNRPEEGEERASRSPDEYESLEEDPEDKWQRILYTMLIYLTYLCHGLGYLTSSTLLDVADQTHSTPVLVSAGFSVKTSVYCLGAVFFAWLLNRINRQVGVVVALTGATTAVIAVPLVPSVHWYWATQALAGFSNAGLDISCLSWLLDMWSSDAVNPFMQGLYLCFSCGMMASSLIAAPFLSHVASYEEGYLVPHAVTNVTTAVRIVQQQLVANATTDNSTTAPETDVVPIDSLHESRLIIPYSLIAGFCLMSAMAHTVAYVWKPFKQTDRTSSASSLVQQPPLDHEHESRLRRFVSQISSPGDNESTGRVVEIVLLGSLLLGCLEGAGYSNSSFIPTFAVFCDLHLSKQEGAVMYSLLSGSAAVTLLACAWIATRVSSRDMLYIGTTLFLVGNISLLYASSQSVDLMILSVVLLGAGYAIFAPNTYSFLSQQLSLTNGMFGCFTFTKSVGRSLAAYVTGLWIQDHPAVLVYTNFVCLFFAFAIILIFHFKVSPHIR